MNTHIVFSGISPIIKDLPTRVNFDGMSAENINGKESSFMKLAEGAKITFRNSVFNFVYNYAVAAVLHVGPSE